MNYQQFVGVIKEKVALSLGEGMSLNIHTTLKNNGRERVGITISDKRVNLFPTIYLEEYFHQFLNGNSIEAITESIVNVYHEVKFEHSWEVNSIKDFSFIQSKIVHKLIHAAKNETFLKATPHIPYLDLAIVFYILFDVDESGSATVPITYDLIELWETSVDEVYRIAMMNSPKLLPATFKPMRVVVEELLGNPCDKNVLEEDIMFVLSNPLRSFGASCIVYDGILEQIADQLGENYYVLPSSIHEMIIIPESQCPDREYLCDMVTEINETQVEIEEVLSDNVYYYDSAKCVLT